ncbi:MAG: hypothetical protein KAX49_16945 [Halanaerobiales bacterium]|nr:hypothetical protein [Halanaerobiales bacterium]
MSNGKTKKRKKKIRTSKDKTVEVICDLCEGTYDIPESRYYEKIRKGWRYFYCSPECSAQARREHIWDKKSPTNIPDEFKRVYDDIPLLPKESVGFCPYCHTKVNKSEIFCRKHTTEENLGIFEATQELPFHPRGWWSYEIIKDWLRGEKQILLKMSGGGGKSLLEDIIAYINLTLNDKSFTLIGSISMPIAVQHIERIREWISSSPFRNKIVYDSREQIKLDSGARVLAIAQSERTRGGYHPDLVLLDEIARIRPAAYYGLFYQMGRTEGATHIYCSTPFLGCYDNQTEILTENGFKFFKDVNLGEKVATMNLNNEQLEYQYPLDKQEYNYEGNLISLQTRGVDLKVTPNHNIFYVSQWNYKNKTKKYSSCQASNLLPEYQIHIPKSPLPTEGRNKQFLYVPQYKTRIKRTNVCYDKIDKAFKIPMDLWLEFMGYFLSEGCVRKTTGQVKISQKKFKEQMFKCCRQVAKYFNRKGGEESNCFTIQNPQLSQLLSGEKRIPNYVFKSSLRQRKIFLDAFSLGDGLQAARKYNAYYLYLNNLTEPFMGDDFQRLFVTMGISTTSSVIGKNKSCLEISGNSKRFADIRTREKERDISEEYYKGKVYCFTVPNHTLIVRRKGKVSVSGNSGVFQPLWYAENSRNYSVPLKDCWFISEETIENARKSMSPTYFDQVFKAEFVASSNRVISDELLMNSIIDKPSGRKQNLIMGLDFGRKRDHTAIVIITEEGEVIYTEILPLNMNWREQYALIRNRVKKFQPYRIMGDATNMGDVIIEELSDLNIEGVLMSNDKLKHRLIDNLLLDFSYNSIHIPRKEEQLIDQLSSYIYLDENMIRCGPEGGAKDDLLDAFMICCSVLERKNEGYEGKNKNSWAAVGGEASGASGESSPWKILW